MVEKKSLEFYKNPLLVLDFMPHMSIQCYYTNRTTEISEIERLTWNIEIITKA